MKRKKKIMAMLLAFCFVAGMTLVLPQMTSAAAITEYDVSTATENIQITAAGDYRITGTASDGVQIIVNTSDTVNITFSSLSMSDYKKNALDIQSGTVKLTMEGVNTISGGDISGIAGITIADKATLNIHGDGTLNVTGSTNYYGSGDGISGGTVNIYGGTVTLTGGDLIMGTYASGFNGKSFAVRGGMVTVCSSKYRDSNKRGEYDIIADELIVDEAGKLYLKGGGTVDCDSVSCESHYGGNATCYQQATCTICSKPYGTLESHTLSYDYQEGAITESCQVSECGHTAQAELSLDQAVSLTYCGKEIKPYQVVPKDNNWSSSDLTLDYSNNINVSEAGAQVEVRAGASAITTQTFYILPKEVTATITANSYTYGDKKAAEAELNGVVQGEDVKQVFSYTGQTADGSPYSAKDVPTQAGEYQAELSLENSNYTLQGDTSEAFQIKKATLTVTAKDTTVYYGNTPDYTVQFSGWQYEDTEKDLNGTLEFDSDYTTASNVGTYPILPKGYESYNYDFDYKEGTLTVEERPVTVTIADTGSVYGDDIASLTGDDDGGIVNGDFDVYQLATTAVKGDVVGRYDIVGTKLNDNYDITFANEKDSYEITSRKLTVTVDVADKQYDGTDTAVIDSASLNNIVEADHGNITLCNGTAAFSSVGVEKDIPIVFTDFTLEGDAEVLKNYTLIQPTGVTASIVNGWEPVEDTEYTASSPNANGWLNTDMEVTAAEGYELSLMNTLDGIWSSTLTGSVEGVNSSVTFYVRNTMTGAISEAVTVAYQLDKNTETTKTSGTVSFGEETSWTEFLSDVSFKLRYGEAVTVRAEASDPLSGVSSIEYYEYESRNGSGLTLEEVKGTKDWKKMPDNGVEAEFRDGKQFIYYIRITDKAGNMTWLSTDGVVYDASAISTGDGETTPATPSDETPADGKTDKDGAAGTGDDSDMLPWVLLASTALMIGIGAATSRKRMKL